MNIIITSLIVIAVVIAIIKKVKTQTVLILAGLLLMLYSYLGGYHQHFVSAKESTGSNILDMFAYIRYTLAKDVAGLGLTIMAGAGFAKYMDHIGASTRMVEVTMQPLKKLKAPYVVAALGFATCMFMSLAIQSASALSTLTMVTVYPVVRRLGVSKLAAASVVASGHLLDIGPAAATSIVVAKTAEISISQLFVEHQLPVYVVCGIFATITHYFWQKYLDKKNVGLETNDYSEEEVIKKDSSNISEAGPMHYVFLPALPLFLILFFSEYGIKVVHIDVITAMLVSLTVAMLLELIRYRDIKKVAASIQVYFDGMGKMFAVTVTLVTAAKVFAYGITSTGVINLFIQSIKSADMGANLVTLIVSGMIVLLSVLTGSGVAVMYSFAPIVPSFAAGVGADTLTISHAMQNAASLGRLISPVAAVMIIVAGMGGVNPVELVKRNSMPILVGLMVSMIMILGF